LPPNLLPTKAILLLDSSKKLLAIITNWEKWETGNFHITFDTEMVWSKARESSDLKTPINFASL
ncbi:TPA: hypothetical protein AB5F21_003429, partial [Vibrio cholerae]